MEAHPRLAIGLPVRNGGQYLRQAVTSLLSQTYADFRLLISDNASTDATPEIGRELARRDGRVTYVRHEVNIGAAPNFNFAFRQTRGEYFKWAAHDDLCEPEFLERCVEMLDADRGVVLCHSYSNWVDAAGSVVGPAQRDPRVASERPGERFIAALKQGYPALIWGVMRRDAAAAAGLIPSFVGSDRYFLAGLLLRGRAALVPEYLFSVRKHDESFTDSFYRLTHRARRSWFDPRMRMNGLSGMTVTTARLVRLLVTDRYSMRDRAACAAYLGRRLGGYLGHRALETATSAFGDPARGGRERARVPEASR